MPIYEYNCKNCGKGFEVLQKFSDPPILKCPSCSGEVTKLISQCSFHLKGTGWYATDYAKKSGFSDHTDTKPEMTKCDDSVSSPSKDSTD
ncbi:MAG: zinc ribbon domain-containing protein [Pseudomonadota bacterium]